MFEANAGTAERILRDVWGGGNLDLLDELCTDDFVDHDPLMGDTDRQGLKERIALYRSAFPDLSFEIEDCFAADDKVAIRWRATGTFENSIMGQEPTNEKGEPITGIGIERFEDGLVAESWGAWDAVRFMQNIGVMSEGAFTAAG